MTQKRVFLALRLMDSLLYSISCLKSWLISVYSFAFPVLIAFLSCIIWLSYGLHFPPKHLSYFLFYKLPFILGPSIPPLQSIPGCLQVCYTFRNWKSPFTTLLVWFYSFKIPCLFLCLHRHFSGIGPQVTPKNRWQACKLWIFGYLCLYSVLPLNE